MNQLLGRGVNLGNAFDAPSEGEWGVVIQEEYFQIIKYAASTPFGCLFAGQRTQWPPRHILLTRNL